ncbi:hypothetical protein SKAU_G00422590 [Synaphobranchus kaupii]|uniref:Uncharacterized protein n=1 Tax=Synaphobranchus kaupii TaxID=118154 RepID=A0A9Q1E6W7_SYNKA|nr:hypothetical protein SKAU_G00422590 [Synaphobranchus kaupii]
MEPKTMVFTLLLVPWVVCYAGKAQDRSLLYKHTPAGEDVSHHAAVFMEAKKPKTKFISIPESDSSHLPADEPESTPAAVAKDDADHIT